MVLMDLACPISTYYSAAQLIRRCRVDLPPPMAIMITCQRVLPMRAQQPPFHRFSSARPVTKQSSTSGMLHGRTGRPGQPAVAPGGSAPSGCGRPARKGGRTTREPPGRRAGAVELQLRAPGWAPPNGGRAFSRCRRRSATDRGVLDGHRMHDIDGPEAIRESCADGRLPGLLIRLMIPPTPRWSDHGRLAVRA